MFQDRHDAALQLAARLSGYRGQHPLVLGIPRGGVPIAHGIAGALDAEFDVLMARKIPHPLLPEYAIGAVNEEGWAYYSPFADTVIRDPADLDVEKLRQLDLIRRRRARYTPARKPLDIKNRLVIVVDDGLATGATMIAALQYVRARQPRKLVCAVPVASCEALGQIQPWVDEWVCLLTPARLQGISLHYRHFPPVSDDEVVDWLKTPLSSSQDSHHEPEATRLS
jgi:putative phosphoribosyl transferase